MKQHLYLGSYTESAETGGIHYAILNTETGELCYLACVAHLENPTYLAVNRARNRLYSFQEVSQAAGAMVCAFRINPDKTLTLLNELPVPGDGPCHLSLDVTEHWLFVSNYGSGSLVVYRLDREHALQECAQVIQHQGKGSHPNQDVAHTHCAVTNPNGTQLWVAELGANAVLCYDFNPAAKTPLTLQRHYPAEDGAGPRHLVFHPDGEQLFVINELDSSLTHYRYHGSELTRIAIHPTLPQGYQGDNSCAAIKLSPCGQYVLASNRGHDSIVVFRLSEQQLAYQTHLPAGGKTPRDFSFDSSGAWLIIAHQDSSSLCTYKFNRKAGQFMQTYNTLSVEQPVCVTPL
jgi:6-phosphogluconolactonase